MPIFEFDFEYTALKKLSIILFATLVCFSCTKQEPYGGANDYVSVLKSLDWGSGPVYAIGHKNPDTDATCSAITYANLMQTLGYKVEPRISSKINNETKFVLNSFGTQTPQILPDASGKTIIMTDHSDYNQAVEGMKKANIIQIIDHHALGGISTSKPYLANVKPVGSTCTIVFTCYNEYRIDISKEMAGLMFSGILSDTENLSGSTVTKQDSIAVDILSSIAMIHDRNAYYKTMLDSASSYYGMTDIEIFYSDYKNYDSQTTNREIGVGSVNAQTVEVSENLRARMTAVMPQAITEQNREMVFCMIVNKTDKYTDIIWHGDGAKEAAEAAFGSSEEKGYIRVNKIMNRKKDFIPAISKALAGTL